MEKVFAVEPKDDWIDILMWDGPQGGIFGHAHYRISESRSQTECIPCSDVEEIEIMREHYEEDGHRTCGRGPLVSFAEYLECFSYLGPEESDVKRRKIIERLKGESYGARVEDTSRRAC